MGTMQHNAIIATGMDERIDEAYKFAMQLGAEVLITSVPVINGYKTLVLPPDGSKEGWDESELGDARRAKLREYLDKHYFHWVEVRFGEYAPSIEHSHFGKEE
jgi:hypothetical protein